MSTRILAIDTATEACSVALQNHQQQLAHFELCPREHTQRILPLVQTILEQGGLPSISLMRWPLAAGREVLLAYVSVSELRKG